MDKVELERHDIVRIFLKREYHHSNLKPLDFAFTSHLVVYCSNLQPKFVGAVYYMVLTVEHVHP